ncbi:tetratricopeptide repeat protein [Moorena producens PAL-8-15-08-1]|uniref:Tetratricopeptide repeat protein n=1 Tax=Moorena producens PAL-8-15-08-1 TaxID=1458985 RepID=A0A1D8U3J8_9CYAN|nr:tetratricopeptide repeat protein [Moorena producens PAL-8-15-08-1]
MNRGTPHFVGRDPQLEQLHEEFQQTDQLVICAIAGMGGVGKTELALQYALKNQDNYPGGLCWFPVRGVDLGTQIVSFARELGLTIPDELEFKEQVRYCWGHWPEGTALIVLDDVPSFSKDYKQRIQPYLPPAQSRFKVLVTSRQRPGASYRRIDLDVLSPGAALELLESLVGKERIEKELNEAEALCEWLGYLPLGLELVGRYLYEHPTLKVTEVQEQLKHKRLEAQALCEQQPDMTAELGVAAAFELSWSTLSEEAKHLGCLLSLFAAATFDWKLVEQCVQIHESRQGLKTWIQKCCQRLFGKSTHSLKASELWEIRVRVAWPTANRSLLKLNLLQLTEQQTYRLHQLIREFFQTKLAQLPEADSYKRSFCQVMVAVAKKIPDRPTLEIIAAVNPAIPHLVEAATVLTDWLRNEDLPWPFIGLGKFYQGQGTYDQAELWWKQCLEITRSRLGHHHPLVATSLNNLAALYDSMGRYDQAEPLYQQALELYKQRLGHDHPLVATSLNNLAFVYYGQGRYHEAECLYLQALELFKKRLGEDHPHVAQSLNNLGLLYSSQGQYDQAESLYVQALEMRKQRLGTDHPDLAQSLNNLAALYEYLGRYDQAEPLFQQALEMRKQLLGHHHPDVATSLNGLAGLYYSMGRCDQAEPLYQKALDIRKQLLGHDHPLVATSLNNLAGLYYSMGRYDQAEPLFQQALEMTKQRLGHDHPDVATSLNNLGGLYSSMGRYDQAEPLLQQALEMTKQLLGDNHPHVASSLNNLAALYESMERYHQAEPLYQQALEIAERTLGSNHPNTVTCRENLESLRDNLSQ